MVMAKTLGQRLRELREHKDLSLRDLAKKVEGSSAAHLSDIEFGRRFPSAVLLPKLAQALDTTVEDLQQYDSRPPVEELKRMSEANPRYGFALRKMVEKQISPEDIEKLIEDKSKRDKKE